MSELKRCPFCGGEARLQRKGKKHGYYVICKTCGCRTPYYQYQFLSLEELRDTAIATWNTRKPIEIIVERLEEAMRECRNGLDEDYDFGIHQGLRDAIEIIKEEGEMNE